MLCALPENSAARSHRSIIMTKSDWFLRFVHQLYEMNRDEHDVIDGDDMARCHRWMDQVLPPSDDDEEGGDDE
jgi:hypothetical protein